MTIAPTTATAMAAHRTARADRFDAQVSHTRHRAAWRQVSRAAMGDAPHEVIDLSCGTGACADLLAALGHSVTAVDGSIRCRAIRCRATRCRSPR